MKSLQLAPFTFRMLLVCSCLAVVLSCKGQTSNSEKTEATPEAHTETTRTEQAETPDPVQETATDSIKGNAAFEAGIKAAGENNMPAAFSAFTEAAKAGHIYAQYNLGLMYEQGLGTTKNLEEAVHWYNASAMQGNSAAQFNLGVCYENGIGTAVDFDKANAWYRKASVQGDGLAIGNLGMLYVRGDGVEVNKVAGIALLLTSATMDTSPENNARNNISSTKGLTSEMVAEAQTLSGEMTAAENLLNPLDAYLEK